MKFLLYGINFAPELTGIGKYSGEMVEFLSSKGHEVTVVTAPPYYPEWEIKAPYKKWLYQKENLHGATVIRCPMYVPSHPRTLTRLVHLVDFALSSFFGLFFQVRKKPDVIMVVEPTFFCVPATLLFAKMTGAKTWLHIQDFEIDAMFGLGMAGGAGFLKRIAYAVESWLLKRFDVVSSISHSMLKRAETKGVDAARLRFLPNWADMEMIKPMPGNQYYRNLWQLRDDDIVLLYSGNIGKKQGLEMIIEAARHFAQNDRVKFVIVGDGAHKAELQQQAEGLFNIQFHPLQPYENLSRLMAVADIHLVVQKAGAADLVLPSKLTTILAAGGYSIITADNGTALGDFCEANPGIAWRVAPEDTEAFISMIQQTVDGQGSRAEVNALARAYAEKNIERKAVLGRLECDLLAFTGEQ